MMKRDRSIVATMFFRLRCLVEREKIQVVNERQIELPQLSTTSDTSRKRKVWKR